MNIRKIEALKVYKRGFGGLRVIAEREIQLRVKTRGHVLSS